jgi:pimeloyl-ACP methyl ester carboxylesterase
VTAHKLATLSWVFLVVLLVFGQNTLFAQSQRDCGPLSPTSSVRPAGESPCSDTHFLSDIDFQAKQGTPASIELSIDRFIGDPAKLLENGFLEPKAKLKIVMKGDSRGQLSEIKFNGTPLRPFVPASTWTLHEFDVPVERINFRSEPLVVDGRPQPMVLPANEVVVSMIGGSLIGDWVSLEIKVARPVLLIHGIMSNKETWNKWTSDGGFLKRTGLPVEPIDVGPLDTIESNAEKISKRVADLNQLWKVDSLTLVGHSKGGLEARLAAENGKSVSTVIMVGTPNEGSPAVDGIVELLSNEFFKSPRGVLEQLLPKNMLEFNKKHGAVSKVEYIAIAGDFVSNCKPGETQADTYCEKNRELAAIVGQGDLVVSLRSVYSLPYALNLPPITSKSDIGCPFDSAAAENPNCAAVHVSLLHSETLFLRLKPFIGKPVSD